MLGVFYRLTLKPLKHRFVVNVKLLSIICHSWTAKGLRDVVQLIMNLSSGKSLIDRAWIIFYWITQNIEYDAQAYFSNNIRHQTPDDIFANRRGVCDAFGTIFETLCTATQIECKKISGYAKGYGFKLEQKSFTQTNHAWNVARLEGHWYLIDSTWGEGHFDSNNRAKKELDTFYFMVRPEQMIYRHLPENSNWQLLMSPISMDDFIRFPYVYPTFFEHNLEIIYPRHTSMASFNSSLGHAEVLLQASSDVRLIGGIEQTGSRKIPNGSLIQYDADRQLWQCLFAPQHSTFHTLTLYARRDKQINEKKTAESKYSCVIQFGLDVPSEIIKRKTFPLTYSLFTECQCQIIEPLDGVLKSGSKVTINCRIPGAYCGRLLLDGNWLSENLIKDGIFKRQITVPRKEIILYVKLVNKQNSSNYDGLLRYSVK